MENLNAFVIALWFAAFVSYLIGSFIYEIADYRLVGLLLATIAETVLFGMGNSDSIIVALPGLMLVAAGIMIDLHIREGRKKAIQV